MQLHILTGCGGNTVAHIGVDTPVDGPFTATAAAGKLDIVEYWRTNGKTYMKVIKQNLTP